MRPRVTLGIVRRWLVATVLLLGLVPACGGDRAPDGAATLVLMATTDVHGWLLPWDYEAGEPADRGLALLAPLVDSIRQAHPGATALVDSGDLLQGSPLAAAFTPLEPGVEHPVITAMNVMEYDAAALGNHEFNFGIRHLNRVIRDAHFPFLAANVLVAETGEPAYPEYVILERTVEGRPLRIGVTAVLPPGVAVWDRDHVEGQLVFPEILQRLQEVVPRMRAVGTDVIVVAAHNAFEGTSYDMELTGLGPENQMAEVAREVEGIDVIFLGHSHQEVVDSTIAGTLFVQAGARASSLAVATLELIPEGADGWRVTSKRGTLLRPDPDRSSPALEGALMAAHERAQAMMDRVIAVSDAPWSARESRVRPTPIMAFVHHVQKKLTGAQLSAAASFNLEAGLPEGEITVAHLARLYPYDNNLLRAVRITGADLRAYLEHSARYFLPCPEARCDRLVNPDRPGYNFDMISGADYTLDLTRPVGSRVVRLEVDGQPVSGDDEFTLALNNYRQAGGGGFPAVAAAELVYEGTESIRALMIREFESRGAVSPDDVEPDDWELVPNALAERALREMRPDGR
jgi:2',3'-cyclic-nucleotide 2'-phosphodiesterase (5'-nucleotidase family)